MFCGGALSTILDDTVPGVVPSKIKTDQTSTYLGNAYDLMLFPGSTIPFSFRTFISDGNLGGNAATDIIIGYSLDYTQMPCTA